MSWQGSEGARGEELVTSTPQHARGHALREAAQQRRLSDARFAADDRDSSLAASGAAEQRLELLEMRIALQKGHE
jgi:hypothetical protein